MDNIIEFIDVGYKYKDNVLFEHLDLDIEKGSFLTLVGKSGSGKTTLMKLMTGLIKSNNKIKINGLYLKEENILSIRSKIGFVFENPDINIIADTVEDDILYAVSKEKYSQKALEKRFKGVVAFLEIEHLLKKSTSKLSGGEKQLVAVAGALMTGARILILDNCFSMLDGISKDKILKKLRMLTKDKTMTIIYITSDIEDTLYGTHVALLGDKRIKFYGKKNRAFEEEHLFLEEGIELPFLVQLSSKLKYYSLIDKTILDMNKMVNEIWK